MATSYVDIIGMIAAVSTTLAFVPQALKVIQTKQTKDLSLPMYIILSVGLALWLTYGILITDWPIILANTITLIFTLTILVLKIKHG